MASINSSGGEWSTPRILQTGLFAIFGTTLLLMLAAINGALTHRQAIKTVGQDSAPSIIAAQHISAALADMDANAANELLDPAHSSVAMKQFEARRLEAVNALVAAAQNITYGDAERIPIQQMAAGMGTYAAQMQAARVLRTSSTEGSLAAYRSAAQTIDTVLLPAAAALDKANNDVLNASFAAQRNSSLRVFVLLAITVLLAVFALIGLQVFISRRMRRTLNPLLILATLGVLSFGFYTSLEFRAADHELKVAKEDAFESIHALWLARSLSYSANSDESRYLLDPAHAAEYESEFFSKVKRIANFPAGLNRKTALQSLGEAKTVPRFTGYLADELNNITFEGEREAALRTLTNYLVYWDVDKQIRALEVSAQHNRAVALCVGTLDGQSDWAFNRFDASLGKTLDVNQSAFNASVNRAFNAVAHFEVIAPIAAAIIAGLSWLGMRARIREYL